MLSEANRILVREILDLPSDSAIFNNRYTQLAVRLNELSASEADAVAGILNEYEAVRFSTGRLSGDYSDDPATKRTLPKRHLSRLLGVDTGGTLQLQRG